jgi:hypothetical protein
LFITASAGVNTCLEEEQRGNTWGYNVETWMRRSDERRDGGKVRCPLGLAETTLGVAVVTAERRAPYQYSVASKRKCRERFTH